MVANSDYVGEGYGFPAPSTIEAITMLARHEGILLDPVYSGKGMAGLIDLIRKGAFKKGENVVFIHTGGSAALFGYVADFGFDDRPGRGGLRQREDGCVKRIFQGNFTQQEPIPEDAIARAVEVMRSGRLHRYNTGPGELSEAVLLEQEFAKATGARYCLACASGGYALATALKASGLAAGEAVLTNGFTLSPVPGAIASAGGRPVLVEITGDLVIDLDDLETKIECIARPAPCCSPTCAVTCATWTG